ncbi:MAG: hypothetical protein AAF585_09450 [Verrucomicrobiota bacterium]
MNESGDGQTKLGAKLGMQRFRKWEVIGLRVLFAFLIYQCLPLDGFKPRGDEWFGAGGWFAPAGRVEFDTADEPRGLAKFVPVTFMSEERLQLPLWILCGFALISYVWGRGLIFSIPFLTLVMLLSRSLENSQGFVFHGFKIIGLILLTQSVVVIVHAILTRFGKRPASYELNDYLVRFAQVAIVAAYVIAGLTKIHESNGRWVENSHYTAVDVVKTYRQNYYKRLDPDFGEERVPYAAEMLENPTRARLMMTAGLALELFCFIALWNRWLMAAVGVAIIVFHRMVEQLMNLQFIQNERAVFIFLVNPVFWIGVTFLLLLKLTEPRQEE